MKRVWIGASLLLIVFAMAGLRSGKAQQTSAPQQEANNGAPPPANPLKVAILHWYKANLTTSFKVGKQPYDVAFDGENIWSADSGDASVTKLARQRWGKAGYVRGGVCPTHSSSTARTSGWRRKTGDRRNVHQSLFVEKPGNVPSVPGLSWTLTRAV
jgi:hypothetical protein